MRFPILAALVMFGFSSAHAETKDPKTLFSEVNAAQRQLDALVLDLYASRDLSPAITSLNQSLSAVGASLADPGNKKEWEDRFQLWTRNASAKDPSATAALAGEWQAWFQHTLAREMIFAQTLGDSGQSRAWRTLIKLPKYADAVQGTLALQAIKSGSTGGKQLTSLLAREYLIWQATRIRERSDALADLVAQKRQTPLLIICREAELKGLASFPQSLISQADLQPDQIPARSELPRLHANDAALLQGEVESWKEALLLSLPNLLTEKDVKRRERLMLKLIRLVPMEYNAGVRDGEIVIPLEYQEAVTFTRQARQILAELQPHWKLNRAAILNQHGAELELQLQTMEDAISGKKDREIVAQSGAKLMDLLQGPFALSLRKEGKASEVVEESVLEIRTFLTQSLQHAKAGNWTQAENARIEAYTTFDLEIERRVLPREPNLALRAERSFLDGEGGTGIKAALDARLAGRELQVPYEKTLALVQESQAVLKVGLSPGTVAFTAFTIMTREGLEAVVILAALLAGFRGPENSLIRSRLAMGAWSAVGASILVFLLSLTIVQSLSRYGEKLEAVISILAVIILLMVTNWVFHKVYWVEWNARLRSLSKKVENGTQTESLAMVGVGFLTIFREGFESTLFLQSLILEGGWAATVTGAVAGLAFIGVTGFLIFVMGKRMPYRKLLVITGVLVVSILVAFIGSTVRLFQTIGWLPIHPIHHIDIPAWAGTWLGLYPSWEGFLLPLLGLAYVSGAWLWVKWSARKTQVSDVQKQSTDQPVAPVH